MTMTTEKAETPRRGGAGSGCETEPAAESAPGGGGQRVVALVLRHLAAAAIAAGLVAMAYVLHDRPGYGPETAFTLIAGAAFGVLLQRSRFCFFCILRDFFERRDSRGVLGILAALAVGSVGYLVVFGARYPDPTAGYLPWEAHIAPASWAILLGGFIFGVGMSLSGSCISAHLYRLGEGSLLAPIALIGSLGGFVLAFRSWNWFYLNAVADAPAVWLPERFGYGGAMGVQFSVLAMLAVVLLWMLRFLPRESPAERSEAPLRGAWRAVFVNRWPTWMGGVGIGILGTFTYMRTEPLGVTAELSRQARELAQWAGVMPARLEGLDRLAGCTPVESAQLLSGNGVFVVALIFGSLCVALLAGQFRPKRESLMACGMALVGGGMLGYGAMIALGCTIGTLLSGIHAFALSGWIFFPGVVAGVGVALPLRRLLLK